MDDRALYVTEGEIARRMGVGIRSGRKAIQKMREHPKFPAKTIGGKRYWPSVRDFLEIWNNRSIPAPGIQAGQEQTDNGTTKKDRGVAWARLEASKERLGRRMARAAERRREGLQAVNEADRRVHEHAD